MYSGGNAVTEGGCLCGEVRFSVECFDSSVFKCHCSLCRKTFGGASSAAALAAESSFRWLKGREQVHEYRCESGFLRRFCPRCGSVVPQFLPDYQLQWIPMGLLDTNPGLTLKHHIHVASKADWEIIDDEARQHAQGFDS